MQNIEFEGSSKICHIGKTSSPIFEHAPQCVQSALALGVGDGVNVESQLLLPRELPVVLSSHRMEVLATICRAIHAKRPVAIRCHSMSSSESERVIVPFTLVDTSLRWHARAIGELDLVPHPRLARPEIIKMDYGMTDGSRRICARAAVAGYMLLRWSVDASPDHSIKEEQYRLWLSDPLALYGVGDAKLAPGYRDPAISAIRK